MAKIQITSPVRPITSGKAPTKDTLAKGQIAVGAVSGEQCIYINPDGTQVVDALKDVKAKITSEKNTTAAAIDSLNSKVNGINNSKGAANGIATLDASGKVPSAQLPSYVDDVLEFANQAAFPSPGESGKIYIAIDTNKSYRWGGTAYTEISKSLALGETASTAYAGSKGKANADAIAAIKRDKYVKPDGWEIDSTGNNFAEGEVGIDGTAGLGDGVNIRCEAGEAIANSAVVGTKSTVLTIPNATASKNGMMSASDKSTLDTLSNLKGNYLLTGYTGIPEGFDPVFDSYVLEDEGIFRVSFKAIDCGYKYGDRLPKTINLEIPFLENGIQDGEPWGLLSTAMGLKLVNIPAPETILTEVELVVQTI